MEKILLTGATGFIGTNLLNKLCKENKVFILVRKIPKKKIYYNKNIIILKYKDYNNLNIKLKKIKIDTVIHCATHYVKVHSYSDIKKLINSNILLGNIILENLIFMKTKKFINFSTVWQDPSNTGGEFMNLYSAYKNSFSKILKFYKKIYNKINFFEILISDTFGYNDNRNKLVLILKKNFNENKTSKIVSKNLFMNLLNINDIISAVIIILKRKVKPGRYLLKNFYDIKIIDLIKKINLKKNKKIKVKWLSKKIIKYKISKHNRIKNWKPKESNMNNIINYIISPKL